MRPLTTTTLASLILTSTAGALGLGSIEPGQPFPDLVLPALEDGRPRSLAELRGERVVLHVFASW